MRPDNTDVLPARRGSRQPGGCLETLTSSHLADDLVILQRHEQTTGRAQRVQQHSQRRARKLRARRRGRYLDKERRG